MKPRYATLLLICAALAVYLGHAYAFLGQINDDAFITFRYSENLAAGRGPYFNPGEHVEGYTNFSLMVLMAGVIAALGNEPDVVLGAAKLVGVGSGVIAILLTCALATSWLRRVAGCERHAGALGALAGLLVAINAAFAVNSTTGLETTLDAALLIAALWLSDRAVVTRRWHGAGAVLALAALTRPDAIGAGLVILAARAIALELYDRAGRRRLLIDGAILAAVVVGHLALRAWLYDGELVPNTFFAKEGGLRRPTSLEYVSLFSQAFLGGPLALLPLLIGLRPQAGPARRMLPALCLLAFGVGAVFLTGADWMIGGRLLVPYLPAWAALAVVGLAVGVQALPALRPMPVRSTALATAVLSVVLLLAQGPDWGYLRNYVNTRAEGYVFGHVRLANWLKLTIAPGETVALMDIGLVGYINPQLRILDITGLTDRFIAKSPGVFLDKIFDPAYVLDQKPAAIILTLTNPPAGLMPEGEDAPPLVAWTPIEAEIANSPRFLQYYDHPRPSPMDDNSLEALAGRVGANHIFPHNYPDAAYLLAAYLRAEPAATTTTTSQP